MHREHSLSVGASGSWSSVQETVNKALDLLANCQRNYEAAPAIRRMLNLGVLRDLKLNQDDVAEAALTAEIALLVC